MHCIIEPICMKSGLEITPYFAFFWDMGRHSKAAKKKHHEIAQAQLNFIEFFWGAVKKYLRDNCDYTFDTLKANLPKALASVDVKTIRKWEHRTMRWLDAYSSGKGTKEAQLHVKQFSSCKYRSHRRIPAGIATLMDN